VGRIGISLFALVLFSAGCAPVSGTVTVSHHRPGPGYVYVYPDGSCWADDVWYASCPWRLGATYGYYYFDGGYYWYEPHFRWHRYRLPPPHWRRHYHHRHHHHHHPPRRR
jgi:hypothetical protein